MTLRVRNEAAQRRAVLPSSQVRPFGDGQRLAAVEAALTGLAERLVTAGRSPSARASALLSDYVRRPGKRVRPYLCALGHELAGAGRSGAVDRFAAALELLHAFLLVHDDIIDRASTRRGAQALHVMLRPESSRVLPEAERQRIGADLAVVAGDWLYTAAMEAMLESGLAPSPTLAALREVLAICRDTAEGQFDDVAHGAEPIAGVTPAEMLEVCRRKTARYTFEAPLVAGALLAGAPPEQIDALRRFSDAAGIAFQLEDDLLGLFASEEETGKPALADLREAKKTWTLLTAYQSASELERAWLEELFVRKDASGRDLVRVRGIVRRTGAAEETARLIRDLCDKALASLTALPDGLPRAELEALVHWILVRAEALQ